MTQERSFFYISQPCEKAVSFVIECLQQSGLQVLQTFDLQDTRADVPQCTCLDHGSEACDCQMVVLLVYEGACQPASLMAHGQGNQTWFSLIEYPGSSNRALDGRIVTLLENAASIQIPEDASGSVSSESSI